MSNIRLFHPNSIVENSTSLLSKDHTHYVINVMRLKRGSKINFFNKDGEWQSEIIFLEKDRAEVKFLNKIIRDPEEEKNIELAICLVKKTPMELIFQKATELGVSRIIPVISERTEIKDLNYERAKKIVVEATEQSNQLLPPEIQDIVKLKDLIGNIKSNTKLFFADVNSKNYLRNEDLKNDTKKIILVGPEGDFSPSERELILSNASTTPFSISKNILRTDTAVISAISLVNFIKRNH